MASLLSIVMMASGRRLQNRALLLFDVGAGAIDPVSESRRHQQQHREPDARGPVTARTIAVAAPSR
jgi:hypothetical protein